MFNFSNTRESAEAKKGRAIAAAAEKHAAQFSPAERAARLEKSRASNAGQDRPVMDETRPQNAVEAFFFARPPAYSPN
jgi:hypothetical protein